MGEVGPLIPFALKWLIYWYPSVKSKEVSVKKSNGVIGSQFHNRAKSIHRLKDGIKPDWKKGDEKSNWRKMELDYGTLKFKYLKKLHLKIVLLQMFLWIQIFKKLYFKVNIFHHCICIVSHRSKENFSNIDLSQTIYHSLGNAFCGDYKVMMMCACGVKDRGVESALKSPKWATTRTAAAKIRKNLQTLNWKVQK